VWCGHMTVVARRLGYEKIVLARSGCPTGNSAKTFAAQATRSQRDLGAEIAGDDK
jgi:hypothetical protein